jgi:hypothetical protein
MSQCTPTQKENSCFALQHTTSKSHFTFELSLLGIMFNVQFHILRVQGCAENFYFGETIEYGVGSGLTLRPEMN